ncbi:hypothetical protein Pcar_3212 [Syntrophotalea carbinolica DSM 2380]|uniref:Uncharacterized protein n=1 Tax=Syntrophotalea carbinolica (strain DSM 2380 / NBRC 103641 / GraBd1) TaxID=338963 RepID=Q0C6V5_SYNC1|nr:hypothetical protein Pcar_3212 [Syntrophotalea carbinolica DSM 2380]
MFMVLFISLVVLGLYAVIGNFVVYTILVWRGVSVDFLWAGTPGYLAKVCSKNIGLVGAKLTWVARSTDIAFIVVFLGGSFLGVCLSIAANS